MELKEMFNTENTMSYLKPYNQNKEVILVVGAIVSLSVGVWLLVTLFFI